MPVDPSIQVVTVPSLHGTGTLGRRGPSPPGTAVPGCARVPGYPPAPAGPVPGGTYLGTYPGPCTRVQSCIPAVGSGPRPDSRGRVGPGHPDTSTVTVTTTT
eukprot:400116-Rhodomonas_salina.1